MRSVLLALFIALAGMASSHAAAIDELVAAAERDDGHMVMLLLVRGVDPNLPDARGRLALTTALREDSDRALKSLLAAPRLDINTANANAETPLMLAAIKGRLDWAKQLVQKGASINKQPGAWTPLHYACSGPDNGVAAWLLSQGADINARSPNGSTPLMLAAGYGAMDLAEALLKAGADASLRNEQGLNAADFARAAGRDALLKTLSAKPR